MKISFKYEKKNNIYFAVMVGIAVMLYFMKHYDLRVLPVFAVSYYLIKSLHIELSEKLPWLWTGILFSVGAVFSIFCVQHIILTPDLYVETGRKILYLNILCAAAIYFFFHIFIHNPGKAVIAAHVFLVCVAFTDNYVYAFRQNEVAFSDLSSLGTGLSVAKNYHLYMYIRGAYCILLSILFIAFVRKCKVKFHKKLWMVLIDIVMVLIISLYVQNKTENYETQTWELKGSYQNGYVLNYILGVRDSFIRPPKGYSTDEITKLEKKYSGDSAKTEETSDRTPTIIAIMDESFADLSVLGNLQTNVEPTPFISSLTENTVRGYTLSSVFGAKTPNSEWEYMTGNSMAFLPSGSVVYQQYIGKHPYSMVTALKNDGYTTVAMHPYLSTGWKRNTVYPKMGFDETHFMDDGYFDQTQTLRTYITDQELFNKIISRYKQKGTDENLFIMGITMQNHGGYTDYYNFSENVNQTNSYLSTDADQYLSLIHETDKAVQNLITYFSSVDDPVEIVFFGDHQPSLDSYLYQTLNGKGMTNLTMDELEDFYKVPFFIWTNYDTEEKTVDCTSMNFLSTMTLERAGLELPAYNSFLSDLNEVIPAMNSRGYYSETNGRFVHYSDASGNEAKWLNMYKMLQYNSMFDKKNRSSVFFPYLTGE